MSNRISQIIIATLLFLFVFSINTFSGGVFHSVLPIGDSHIGGEYRYYLDKGTPFMKAVYNWSQDRIFYQGGLDLYFNDYDCRLSYVNWKNNSFPGYISEEGIKGLLNIPLEIDRSLTLSVLSGRVEPYKGGYQLINYIKLNYIQNFFFSMNKYMDINLSVLYGLDDEGRDCSIYKFKIPQSYNNFKIDAEVGYINQSYLIRPYFRIADILKGYSNRSEKSKGNKMVSISLEKQKQLFPGHEEFYMTLFKGAVFINAADILTEKENTGDISLKSSAGVGLIYTMGSIDFRIDGLVTSEGNWSDLQTAFAVEYSF